jgi:ABC-type uncharacterized transport system permease subunit
MNANDLKLITSLLIILCIIVSKQGFRAGYKRRKPRGAS